MDPVDSVDPDPDSDPDPEHWCEVLLRYEDLGTYGTVYVYPGIQH